MMIILQALLIIIITHIIIIFRTHGIWFLPSLTEEEATSILHSKEPGVRHLSTRITTFHFT